MNLRKITDYTRRSFNSLLKGNSTFIGLLVLIFLCLGFVNIINHEMWRDELQAWLIAKDSTSIANLFKNLRYEGHPALWHIGLYLLSRFTDQPVVMQLYHLMLATGTIYIFINFSPFTKIQKILFIFGYFPLYEYATISRNYALGVLLIFSFCAVLRAARTRNYLALSCILFLLAHVNVYSLIIAISFGFTLLFESVVDGNLRKSLSRRKWQIVVSILIFVLGISSSILQIMPPPDRCQTTAIKLGWQTHIDIRMMGNTITTIWKSYVPIPSISRMHYHFWNTNILNSPLLQAVLSCILLCLSLLLFVRKPVVFFLYSIGTMGIFAFTYMQYFGYIRHHGHLFILLVACLWISNYYPNIELKRLFFNNLANFCAKYRSVFIVVILSAHLIAATIACGKDWLYPFSASKEVAKFIKVKQLDNMLMLGDRDYTATPVSGYLNKKIYHPASNRFGSFVIWDKKRKILNPQEILKKAKELMGERSEDILLILNYEPDITTYPNVIKIKEFSKSIVSNEKYYLYLMKYRNVNKAK